MNTPTITLHTETRRNAPNVTSTLSVFVDIAQAAVDDARAARLHGIATLAFRLWRGDGGAL